MLHAGSTKPIVLCGFLVGVEMEAGGGTTSEEVKMRIADGLTWMDSIGKVDITDLGEVETIE